MKYPTIDEIKKADRVELARWYRFLGSPGIKYAGKPEFKEKMKEEAEKMDLIIKRFNEIGGFTPEISKQIGW